MKEIHSVLQSLRQPHLAEGLDQLSLAEQEMFLQELKGYSPLRLEKHAPHTLEPVNEYDQPSDEARKKGEELLALGKVACLILAGGQGTRLAAPHPKALTPVTPIRQKTLLQLFCEKTAAASKAFNTPLPLAVMTSPLNHEVIESYLQDHQCFGVADLSIFRQGRAPLLTEEGDWFLDAPGKIAVGPDGNGEALHLLLSSGIAKKWKEQGVEYVMVVQIDNPLADPFDAAVVGYHALTKRDATLKTIFRSDPAEKVGVVVRQNGKIGIQEYSELPPDFKASMVNIGLFCFSLSFIERINHCKLPWHFARKKHHHRSIWKAEKFLFDVLAFAENTGILVYAREDVYAPLKNAAGDKSLATVQQALLDFDRRFLSELTKSSIPEHQFELDPSFYYLSGEQKSKWKNKSLPALTYIHLDV
jgi:UDP-N-acetylglucosamine/UDP-N-acetylgalactosamine diphosphorylase